jgi:hypothetical protein
MGLHMKRILPKSLFAWSKTFIDKSRACSRRCQKSPQGQGHVTVNGISYELAAGSEPDQVASSHTLALFSIFLLHITDSHFYVRGVFE